MFVALHFFLGVSGGLRPAFLQLRAAIGCGDIGLPAAAAGPQGRYSIPVSDEWQSVDCMIVGRPNMADHLSPGIESRVMERVIAIGQQLSPLSGSGGVGGMKRVPSRRIEGRRSVRRSPALSPIPNGFLFDKKT